MNLKSLLKIKKVRVFLVVLLVGITIVGYSVGKAKKVPSEESSTSIPTPIPTQPYLEFQEIKQNAIEQLPVVTDGYTIQYFPDRDYFFVMILKMPYDQYEQEVKDWFKQRGLDVNRLEVKWGSKRGVYPASQ